MSHGFRRTEINSGRVVDGPTIELTIGPVNQGYSDSQIDDYGNFDRKRYPWQPGTRFRVTARFSSRSGDILGTAGFGFWNTPFGDPRIKWPALPKAAWFFYASEPTDLPLPAEGPGRGWFVSTIDASSSLIKTLMPFTPATLLLNNIPVIRHYLWPQMRRKLKISFASIETTMDQWHHYELNWFPSSCRFLIDGEKILETHFSPHGPLAFVAWIDNQFLVATPRGRFKWGTIQISHEQSLFLRDLEIGSFNSQ